MTTEQQPDPTELDSVDTDERLIERIRRGGTPDPDDHLAVLLARLRDEIDDARLQDLARQALAALPPTDTRTDHHEK